MWDWTHTTRELRVSCHRPRLLDQWVSGKAQGSHKLDPGPKERVYFLLMLNTLVNRAVMSLADRVTACSPRISQ